MRQFVKDLIGLALLLLYLFAGVEMILNRETVFVLALAWGEFLKAHYLAMAGRKWF